MVLVSVQPIQFGFQVER